MIGHSTINAWSVQRLVQSRMVTVMTVTYKPMGQWEIANVWEHTVATIGPTSCCVNSHSIFHVPGPSQICALRRANLNTQTTATEKVRRVSVKIARLIIAFGLVASQVPLLTDRRLYASVP